MKNRKQLLTFWHHLLRQRDYIILQPLKEEPRQPTENQFCIRLTSRCFISADYLIIDKKVYIQKVGLPKTRAAHTVSGTHERPQMENVLSCPIILIRVFPMRQVFICH